MNRFVVVVGTNFTLPASPRMVAAMVRQVSASMPRITPWLSAKEKPATPVDTPQASIPRLRIASMVGEPDAGGAGA